MADNRHLPPIPPHADYTIAPAPYVKNHYLVRCKSDGSGFKTVAIRLIGDDLNCRYVGRGLRRQPGQGASLCRDVR